MNYRRKIVERVSEEEGLTIVEDTFGNYHILNPPEIIINNKDTYPNNIYLNSLTTTNFPGTNNFYQIPDIVSNTNNLVYIISPGKKLIIEEIHIVQTRESLSLLGLYNNNELIVSYPFYREKVINTKVPLIGSIEVKVKPGNNLTRVGISLRGIIIDND